MKKITFCALILIFFFSSSAIMNAQNKPYAKVVVYSAAVDALGKIGDIKAKNCLLDALKSKEFFVRAYAAKALGNLGDKSVIPELKELLNDKHYLVRIMAAKSLLKLGDAGAEGLLLAFLSDKNEAVRVTAISGLSEFGNRFTPALLKLLAEEKNPLVRAKALEQFTPEDIPRIKVGKKQKPGIDPRLKAIREALNDKNWETRQAACYGIAVFKDKASVPLLIKRLNDESVYVRVAAKVSLSKLGDKSQSKVFWRDIEDKNPILKVSSLIALANLKDINLIPVLLKEVVEPKNNLHVRKGAARALMILKPELYKILNENFSKARRYAFLSSNNLKISYKINGRDLVSIFISALLDPRDPLREDAVFVLGELKEEITYPYLRGMLFDDNPDIVANAAFVLGELRNREAVEMANTVDDLIKVCKKHQL